MFYHWLIGVLVLEDYILISGHTFVGCVLFLDSYCPLWFLGGCDSFVLTVRKFVSDPDRCGYQKNVFLGIRSDIEFETV